MPVGGPLSRQSSAKVQRYVTDHRHAAITGSYYQLLLSSQMVGKTGDPSPPSLCACVCRPTHHYQPSLTHITTLHCIRTAAFGHARWRRTPFLPFSRRHTLHTTYVAPYRILQPRRPVLHCAAPPSEAACRSAVCGSVPFSVCMGEYPHRARTAHAPRAHRARTVSGI